MTARFKACLTLPDENATAAFATKLSDALQPGDTVLLSGQIGAGKTALCRALIQHRMSEAGTIEDVPSPTFTLIQTYALPGGEIWHADLYRLGDASELVELGLDEAMGRVICLVEWPDRMGDLAPEDALTIEMSLGESDAARIAALSAKSERWGGLIKRLGNTENSPA